MEIEAIAQDIAQRIMAREGALFLAGQVDDLDTAYAIQDAVVPHLGVTCGRKIALNSAGLMQAAGISEPIVGHILGGSALGDEATISLGNFAQLALEPEIACVVDHAIPAGHKVDRENLSQFVTNFAAAFEILDRRQAPEVFHAPSFVANNIFNAGIAISRRGLSLAQIEAGGYLARLLDHEDVVFEGENSAPQDPIEAALFVINHFTGRGQSVAAGEVILCGTHVPPIPITQPGRFTFEVEPGALVNLTISD